MRILTKPLVILIALGLIAGCGDIGKRAGPPEMIRASLDPAQWKLGFHKLVPNEYEITEFIRKDDDINHWRELYTIESSAPPWGASPEDAFDKLKAIREKDCPGVTRWTVIDKSPDTLLYEEIRSKPCFGFAEDHELGKILFGRATRFRLRYTAKGADWAPGERQEWLKTISAAAIQ